MYKVTNATHSILGIRNRQFKRNLEKNKLYLNKNLKQLKLQEINTGG